MCRILCLEKGIRGYRNREDRLSVVGEPRQQKHSQIDERVTRSQSCCGKHRGIQEKIMQFNSVVLSIAKHAMRTATHQKTKLGMFLPLLILSGALSAQTYKDIFAFNGTTNGCCPQYPAIMAQGQDGNLYGITPTGGTSNVGVAFKISPTGTQTVLYNFDVTHGSNPNGGLVMGTDGNFYGTSEHGGAHAY